MSQQGAVRTADTVLGAAAAASPAWIDLIEHVNAVGLALGAVGGAVLVWWRVYIAIMEWAERRDRRRQGEP